MSLQPHEQVAPPRVALYIGSGALSIGAPGHHWPGGHGEETSHARMPQDDAAGLAFLADLVPPHVILAAVADARASAFPVLDALLARTDVPVEAIVRRLARRSGLGVAAPEPLAASQPPLSLAETSAALRTGVLRLNDGRMIVATRGASLKFLLRGLRGNAVERGRVWLASPRSFSRLLLLMGGAALEQAARTGVAVIDPRLTAANAYLVRFTAVGVALCGAVTLLPASALTFMPHVMVLAFFIALSIMRFLTLLLGEGGPQKPAPRIPDADLPIYTVLVPLYHEERTLPDLIGAFLQFDYPLVKLDIKILIEADDRLTLDALCGIELPGHVEIVIVPAGQPRTKPRALNVGLAAARGDYVVVYDAEDRPEPGQLRAAVAAFKSGGPDLVCVQGRLSIDNTYDNWLTRHFTIEYAALFDVLLPSLGRHGRLFPLGGTSNHFRTEALRAVGGWDAYNVTEDADLGVRLARAGHRLGVIDSTTFEEAPNTFGAWLRQRTRWVKGYMITWCVHMRTPVQLWRGVGLRDTFIFHAFIGGVPLAALTLPLFLLSAGYHIAQGDWFMPETGPLSAFNMGLEVATILFGFTAAIGLGYAGVRRRNLRGLTRTLFSLPIYWLCVSLAAWRAVWQLIRAPYLWEKTEHGCAKTSRSHSE